jgi:hypothetical protein
MVAGGRAAKGPRAKQERINPMRIEDMSRDQLDEYHLMRTGSNGENICYYMQHFKPYREFLYDLEEDQLHLLNEMLLRGDGKDAILLQLHEWADAFLEEDAVG